MKTKRMETWYEIGFDCGDYFNGIYGSPRLSDARELAIKVEKEYGETPVIRKRRIGDCL